MDNKSVLDGKWLLVVDDEPDILETLTEILDMCHIDTASDFSTAEKCLSRNDYDAAVFDIMGVNGYKLLDIAALKGLPALMLTAHALTPDNLIRSIKKGAAVYLPKDRMIEIESFLVDLVSEPSAEPVTGPTWLSRLKPDFDQTFGKDWQEKDRTFWQEYDKILAHSGKGPDKIFELL